MFIIPGNNMSIVIKEAPMNKCPLLGLMLLLSLLLSACSSKLMDPMLEQQQPVPQGNEASITFFRTSSFGGMIQAPIAEETASGLELVGISSMDTKIRHVVAPGKHIFVVGGESGSLLAADLAPQRHYYVKVSPGFGWGKTRFTMVPVPPQDLDAPGMQKEIRECTPVSRNDKAAQWFLENKRSMEDKLRTAKEKFQARKDPAEYTLPASYGITELY